MKGQQPRSLSVVHGTALAVTIRWVDRLLGVLSTIILARLLMPEDFGVVALASMAVAFATVLVDFGVNVALIQHNDPQQSHYDTAWTLRLLQMLFTALVLALAAPLIAGFFGDGRVAAVLAALAFGMFLSGLENIGIVAYQRNMQFGAEFNFLVSRRLIGFVVTIVAALLLRSYWALVIGVLVSRSAGVLLSYLMHPMRPRFSLAEFRDIFAISQWMLVRSIGAYLQNHAHKVFVGHYCSTATTGSYTLGDEIAAMPSSELLAPLNRVLFPSFARQKHDPAALKHLFLLALSMQTLLVVPASVGLAMVADRV
ncbi:MAG: oligosaccharide flippase family protein, partial [Gammaproteobacteria bacterium]